VFKPVPAIIAEAGGGLKRRSRARPGGGGGSSVGRVLRLREKADFVRTKAAYCYS